MVADEVPYWRVFYNTHSYADYSDVPRLSSRLVQAATAEEAQGIVRDMVPRARDWRRYIGTIHHADLVPP